MMFPMPYNMNSLFTKHLIIKVEFTDADNLTVKLKLVLFHPRCSISLSPEDCRILQMYSIDIELFFNSRVTERIIK